MPTTRTTILIRTHHPTNTRTTKVLVEHSSRHSHVTYYRKRTSSIAPPPAVEPPAPTAPAEAKTIAAPPSVKAIEAAPAPSRAGSVAGSKAASVKASSAKAPSAKAVGVKAATVKAPSVAGSKAPSVKSKTKSVAVVA